MTTIFLPIVSTPPAQPAAKFNAGMALAMVRSLVADRRQQRRDLRICPALVDAAQRRATMLASQATPSHTDPHGITPNGYARAAGCHLPHHYADDGNDIESFAAGSPDMDVLRLALIASPPHRRHLFGEDDFYRAQRDIGVAWLDAPGSRYGWYLVILIGICEESSGE